MPPDHRLRWGLMVLWVCAMCILGGLALSPSPVHTGPYGDKVMHIIGGVVFMLMPTMLLHQRLVWGLALAFLLLGIGVEVAQNFLGEREPSIEDVFANSMGILSGIWIGSLIRSGFEALPPLQK